VHASCTRHEHCVHNTRASLGSDLPTQQTTRIQPFRSSQLWANTQESTLPREEIFGPVVPLIRFRSEEEAIRLANDTPYGLAAGIQTSGLGKALRLADRIKAGTVWLNTWHKYHPNAPFGGFKMSGYGREQGAEALESYTQYKTIWADIG